MKVLITGCGSGFGYHMALKFAREGHFVYATTRNLEVDGVKEINHIAKEERLSIQWYKLDVTKQVDIDKVSKKVKNLDVLVNNAGFGILGPIERYTTEDFRKQFDVNFFGVVAVTYGFLPQIKRSKKGRIINISSMAGLIAAPAYGLYSTSKHAVEVFSEVLRLELADTKVKVSAIEPGGFETKFSANAVGLNKPSGRKDWFERFRSKRAKSLSKPNFFMKKLRDPKKVANRIYKVAMSKNPNLRNRVGIDSWFTSAAHDFLPPRVWEYIMTKVLKKLKK